MEESSETTTSEKKGPPSSITVPVSPEEFEMLTKAGDTMNGQRPTQVAALLINRSSVDDLLIRWASFETGE